MNSKLYSDSFYLVRIKSYSCFDIFEKNFLKFIATATANDEHFKINEHLISQVCSQIQRPKPGQGRSQHPQGREQVHHQLPVPDLHHGRSTSSSGSFPSLEVEEKEAETGENMFNYYSNEL